MKKGTMTLLVVAAVLLIIGFVIPVSVEPADDMRVVIDHTKKEYSTPTCFEQADFTNNLEDTTLGHAVTLKYTSESECTVAELGSEKKPFLIAILQ